MAVGAMNMKCKKYREDGDEAKARHASKSKGVRGQREDRGYHRLGEIQPTEAKLLARHLSRSLGHQGTQTHSERGGRAINSFLSRALTNEQRASTLL